MLESCSSRRYEFASGANTKIGEDFIQRAGAEATCRLIGHAYATQSRFESNRPPAINCDSIFSRMPRDCRKFASENWVDSNNAFNSAIACSKVTCGWCFGARDSKSEKSTR